MPRQQSTAAKNARRAQDARGGKYTEHLREQQVVSATGRLVQALDEVGLEEAAHLRSATAPDPECDRAAEAYRRAYDRASAADKAGHRGPHVEALWQAVEVTEQAYAALCTGDPYPAERLIFKAVYAGLSHVAAAGSASPCALPAADVLADQHAPSLADAIRECGLVLELPQRRGFVTPSKAAAAAACRALHAAMQVPFGGDVQWTRCYELIEEASALARAACG